MMPYCKKCGDWVTDCDCLEEFRKRIKEPMSPLTEVETQKESWEDQYKTLWLSQIFNGDKEEVLEVKRGQLQHLLLSDRARLVKMLEKEKQPLPDAIVYMPEPVDNIALQKQVASYNKGLDKAISIIKDLQDRKEDI